MKKSEQDKILEKVTKEVTTCSELILDLLDTWSFRNGVVLSSLGTTILRISYDIGLTQEEFKMMMQSITERGLEVLEKRNT